MYAVGMLGSYLTQGVYAVAGPFQPFGGAVDIIVVQQEDDSFKSSPWYVKFGDFQGVLKREKVVDIAVNDAPADFHMCLDYKGEAYFEKEVESDEGMCLALPDASPLTGDNGAEGETESLALPDASSLTGDNRVEGETESPALPDASSLTGDNRIKGETESLALPDASSLTGDSRVEGELERLTDAAMVANANSHSQEAIHLKTESTPQIQKESTPPKQNAMVDDGFCLEEKGAIKEGKLETQEPSNGSNVGLKEDSVLYNTSTQAGLENPKALSTSIGPEAAPAQNDNDRMHEVGASNSLTMTVEKSLNLTEASLTHTDLVETARSETIVTEDSIFQSSTVLTVEEGSCLQAVTFSDAEVVNSLSSNAKVDVEDGRVLVDVWTEEDIEDNGNYENGCLSLENEELFDRFECITVEGERETHVYTGEENINNDVLDGAGIQEMSKDTLVWNSESPLNHDLGDVALAISHNATFLLEEENGGTQIDGAASEEEIICKVEERSNEGKTIDGLAGQAIRVSVSSPSRWRLWPFWFRRSSIEKGPLSTSSVPEQELLAAANVAIGSPFTTEELLRKNVYLKWQPKTKVRTYVPTSAQLASLKLKDGPNKVTFTFSTVLGKTEVDARIYLWKWNTRIVISDVDGTITKSDVLGQVMPLVGRDWSQSGVTRLFSAIKDNGFEVLFLSARAISQAYLTRRFLLNLKQDGEALPEGPVFISPDGLLPSLYREVIRRAPHEFKIACLEGIRELFPKDVNPFYAGFGNRETDEISYLKVGIPKGKIFIINPKGEVVVNHRVDCKSYPSLHALVDEMFPPMSSHEPEDFNAWNYWKIPLPDIDEEELSTSGSKSVKKAASLKK